MASIIEMAEVHLMNVEREVNNLKERKAAVEQEIAKLENYLKEGAATLQEQKASAVVDPKPIQSSLF